MTHIIQVSWWYENEMIITYLDTLKKHSKFQKCGILKLWKFKICTLENSNFQKCFTTYKWGIMYMMYWTKFYFISVKFNFKKLTNFGMISNYHHFSRWNIKFARIYTFLQIYIYFKLILRIKKVVGENLVIFHNKLQINRSKNHLYENIILGEKDMHSLCKVMFVAPLNVFWPILSLSSLRIMMYKEYQFFTIFIHFKFYFLYKIILHVYLTFFMGSLICEFGQGLIYSKFSHAIVEAPFTLTTPTLH
jgi:hypothetical protein